MLVLLIVLNTIPVVISGGGQRLCEVNMRLCPTGLCKIDECIKCDKDAICETTDPKEVVPKGLTAHTQTLTLTYSGPDAELNSGMFSNLSKLTDITITGNISSVANNTFVQLRLLRRLTVTGTKLHSFPNQAFSNGTKFKFLNLTHNQFKELPVNIFSNITHIGQLDLSYNPLSLCKNKTLPAEFKQLKNLYELRLSGHGTDDKELCRNISKDFFLPVQRINNLYLSESLLFHGDQRLLSPLVHLERLGMDNVPRYSECPAAAADLFQNIPLKLSQLTLRKWRSENEFNESCLFNREVLAGLTRLPRLSTFDMRESDKLFGNQLSASIFNGFGRLRIIYVNWCGMAAIENGAFNSVPHISELGVGGNLLGSRQLRLYTGNQTSQLKTLSLNSVGINTVTYNASTLLLSFPNLHMLYLDDNLLRKIPDFGYAQNLSTGLTTLTLNNNAIRSFSIEAGRELCAVMPALTAFKIEVNLLTDVAGIQYCQSSLTQLYLANNFIEQNRGTNFKAIGSLWKLHHLDMSYNKIKLLTHELLANLTNLRTLILASNLIESLENDAFTTTPKLTFLDLSANFLLSFNIPIFSAGLSELVSLYLQANQITEISSDFILSLSSNHKRLKRIGLAGNPLTCSCDDYLSKWVKNSSIIMQVKQLTCSIPENANKTIKLLDYQPNHFFCFVKTPLLISGIVLACVILSLLIAVPCYKYRWFLTHPMVVVRAVSERLREVKFEQKCQYDAFVSYDSSSDADSKWIMDHLIPAVEKTVDQELMPSTVSSLQHIKVCEKFVALLYQLNSSCKPNFLSVCQLNNKYFCF